MEYQKLINLLDNTSNQPTKFRTKNEINDESSEINDESSGTNDTNSQIKFKSSMLRSSLCDYSDAYILVKGTIAMKQILSPSKPENVGKKVIFQNCSLFTDYISEINNTQTDNVIHIDVIMPIYNLLGHSNNYSKTSGGLW